MGGDVGTPDEAPNQYSSLGTVQGHQRIRVSEPSFAKLLQAIAEGLRRVIQANLEWRRGVQRAENK